MNVRPVYAFGDRSVPDDEVPRSTKAPDPLITPEEEKSLRRWNTRLLSPLADSNQFHDIEPPARFMTAVEFVPRARPPPD